MTCNLYRPALRESFALTFYAELDPGSLAVVCLLQKNNWEEQRKFLLLVTESTPRVKVSHPLGATDEEIFSCKPFGGESFSSKRHKHPGVLRCVFTQWVESNTRARATIAG